MTQIEAQEISREAIVEMLDKWYEEGKLTSLSGTELPRYSATKLKIDGKLLSLYAEGLYTTDEDVQQQFNTLWREMRIFKRNVLEANADLMTLYEINKQVKLGAFAKFSKLGRLHILYID